MILSENRYPVFQIVALAHDRSFGNRKSAYSEDHANPRANRRA